MRGTPGEVGGFQHPGGQADIDGGGHPQGAGCARSAVPGLGGGASTAPYGNGSKQGSCTQQHRGSRHLVGHGRFLSSGWLGAVIRNESKLSALGRDLQPVNRTDTELGILRYAGHANLRGHVPFILGSSEGPDRRGDLA
jgi:hypothetical protein